LIALDFPNAIISEDRFFGRRQELERIQTTLMMNQRVPVVVIGERRVGKTSIYNVAIQRLKKIADSPLTPLIVEPRGIKSVDQFIESVLVRMTSFTKTDLRNTGLVGPDNHIHMDLPEQFDTAFFQLISGPERERFLLCVDEFDELIRIAIEAGNGERIKLMGFIHHLVEKTATPLSLFLTMTRLPEGASKEIASPLLAKCEVVELQPFPFQDMTDMVRGLVQEHAMFDVQEMEWLYELSGGHPYITKLLLANLFKRVRVSEIPIRIEHEMLAKANNDAVEDPIVHYAFENIYHIHLNADEKRVLLYLAERNEAVDAGELRVAGTPSVTAAKNLKKRHYLVEHDGKYTIRARFLGDWLRNWAEFYEEIERLHVDRMVNPWQGGTEGDDPDTAETTVNDELHR
jgi:hypothetical protein